MALRRKEDGTYYGDWYVNRKRIRRTSQTKSLELAKQWYREVENELWKVKALGHKTYLWEDAVVGYCFGRKVPQGYDHDLHRLKWLDKRLKGVPLDKIKRDTLIELRDEHWAEVGAATVNRQLNLVSAILNYAVDREWIVTCPKIPKIKIEDSEPEWLTTDEVSRLIRVLAADKRAKHLVAFVTFAIATGLRMSNITKLEWRRVDMERKVMYVKASDAKGRKAIPLPLTDDAMAVLKDQIGKHPERVFTYRGKPYDVTNSRTLKKHAKTANITTNVHPHLFRHTFASWHVMSGTSLYELMHLGGWAKQESVERYAHLSADHLRTAANNRASMEHVFTEALEILKGISVDQDDETTDGEETPLCPLLITLNSEEKR